MTRKCPEHLYYSRKVKMESYSIDIGRERGGRELKRVSGHDVHVTNWRRRESWRESNNNNIRFLDSISPAITLPFSPLPFMDRKIVMTVPCLEVQEDEESGTRSRVEKLIVVHSSKSLTQKEGTKMMIIYLFSLLIDSFLFLSRQKFLIKSLLLPPPLFMWPNSIPFPLFLPMMSLPVICFILSFFHPFVSIHFTLYSLKPFFWLYSLLSSTLITCNNNSFSFLRRVCLIKYKVTHTEEEEVSREWRKWMKNMKIEARSRNRLSFLLLSH